MRISTFAMLMALQPVYALVGKQGIYFQSTPTRPGSKDVFYSPPPVNAVNASQEAEAPDAPAAPAAPAGNYFTTPRAVGPQSTVASVSRTQTVADPDTATQTVAELEITEPEAAVPEPTKEEVKPAAPGRMPTFPVGPTTVVPEPIKATGLPPKTGDNSGLDHIFAQNQAWKATKLAEDPKFFDKLGTTHTPEYMWIGCVDARVPPDVVMQVEAGQMFVQRNVANMVVNTDTNLLSALQYGVNYLKVNHIIVCGHYECGGVKAAEAANDFVAPLELWLRGIRDVYAKHRAELDAIEDANVRHRRLVDLNVIQQCVNVFKTGAVQKRRAEIYEETGHTDIAPLVHAMVFDPTSGELIRLDVDFEEYADELNSVYGLHVV